MKMIVALGGNALLRRGQALSADHQLENIRVAASQLARVAALHDMVLTHGNGPQVGLLALQGDAYAAINPEVPTYPLDTLGAQSQGMLGYLLEQELAQRLLPGHAVATLITRVEVDLKDRAFAHPTKPIGPLYSQQKALELAAANGWQVAPDTPSHDSMWRRVVASPAPQRVLNLESIRQLLQQRTVVIAAGGGGIPVADGTGVEAVIDKDLCAALLAREMQADCLVIATDVDAVYLDWGTDHQKALGHVSAHFLQKHAFAEGSMGPKVQAACDFVQRTGKPCHIGALADIEAMLQGTAGTTVSPHAFAL